MQYFPPYTVNTCSFLTRKDPYIIQMTLFFYQFKMLLIFTSGQKECNSNQCTFSQPTCQLNLLETVVK